MKIKIRELRRIIKETIIKEEGKGGFIGGKEINLKTLSTLSPEAAAAFAADHDLGGEREGSNSFIWIIRDPSDTNESELEEWLTDDWTNLAVTAPDGQEYVLACGDSIDDEYGCIWDPVRKEWQSYMY